MNRWMKTFVLFSASVAMPAAWAEGASVSGSETSSSYGQEQSATGQDRKETGEIGSEEASREMAGRAGREDVGISQRRVSEVSRQELRDEKFGMKPQLGAVFFKNGALQDESRMLGGLTLDLNVAGLVNPNRTHWFAGPSTGVLYSHVGAGNSNFFGSGDASGGSNLVIIPANLKVGYSFTDAFRLSVRGGGNLVYRSQTASVALSNNDFGATGDLWKLHPNAGADLEWGFGQNVGIMVRPDITFASENMYSTTLALSIALS